MLNLDKINREIIRLASLERRNLVPASEAYQASDGRVWLIGSNVGSFARVRKFLAENLGVRDISEGNPGGHFNLEECRKL